MSIEARIVRVRDCPGVAMLLSAVYPPHAGLCAPPMFDTPSLPPPHQHICCNPDSFLQLLHIWFKHKKICKQQNFKQSRRAVLS